MIVLLTVHLLPISFGKDLIVTSLLPASVGANGSFSSKPGVLTVGYRESGRSAFLPQSCYSVESGGLVVNGGC